MTSRCSQSRMDCTVCTHAKMQLIFRIDEFFVRIKCYIFVDVNADYQISERNTGFLCHTLSLASFQFCGTIRYLVVLAQPQNNPLPIVT